MYHYILEEDRQLIVLHPHSNLSSKHSSNYWPLLHKSRLIPELYQCQSLLSNIFLLPTCSGYLLCLEAAQRWFSCLYKFFKILLVLSTFGTMYRFILYCSALLHDCSSFCMFWMCCRISATLANWFTNSISTSWIFLAVERIRVSCWSS